MCKLGIDGDKELGERVDELAGEKPLMQGGEEGLRDLHGSECQRPWDLVRSNAVPLPIAGQHSALCSVTPPRHHDTMLDETH